MQLQTKLDEKTALIKHYLKSWANNILAIGKELTEIKEQKLYKEQFNSLNEYTLDAFGFTDASAYRYIDVYKKYGQNVSRWDKMKDYGMRVLLMSIQVPEDKFDEMLQVIDKSPLKDHTTLARQVKRFAKEVGQQPRYESTLNPIQQSERLLKAKREGIEIKEKYQEFLDIKLNLKLAIEKWIISYKYQELNNLKEELQAISIYLK